MNRAGISEQDRLFYDAYGYLVLRGLFAADADRLARAFDEVFDDPANPRLDYNVVGHRWHSEYLMADVVERHPDLDALRTDPESPTPYAACSARTSATPTATPASAAARPSGTTTPRPPPRPSAT